MKKQRKQERAKKTLLAAVLITAAVLAGCGSADAETSAQAGGDGTVVLKCGVKQAHSPFSYLDDNGNLVGLEEDVVTEAFNRIDGYEVEIVGFDASPSLFSALQAGSIDFASGQYVASAERRELYKFPTQYYALSPMYLVSREEDHFNSLSDIAGETLEFVSTAYEKELIQAYNAENPGAEINIVDTSGDTTTADAMQQIQLGQKNVALIYKSSYDTVQEELNLPGLVLSDEPAIVEDVYQVFRTDVDDAFIALFDEALKSMFDDGTLNSIALKWTGENCIELYQDLVIPVE